VEIAFDTDIEEAGTVLHWCFWRMKIADLLIFF
jgi:hypothetical protein